jgi:hypothetical protein
MTGIAFVLSQRNPGPMDATQSTADNAAIGEQFVARYFFRPSEALSFFASSR